MDVEPHVIVASPNSFPGVESHPDADRLRQGA
jgi:hypothetical protein